MAVTWSGPAGLRGSFLLVAESSEARSAFDLLLGEVEHGSVGTGWLLQCPMGPPPVVAARVFVQDPTQLPLTVTTT
jgi:hypothetical protein